MLKLLPDGEVALCKSCGADQEAEEALALGVLQRADADDAVTDTRALRELDGRLWQLARQRFGCGIMGQVSAYDEQELAAQVSATDRSDALILYVLHHLGRSGGELHQALGWMDAINRDYLSRAEWAHAVNRLLAAGWLQVTGDRLVLVPDARELVKDAQTGGWRPDTAATLTRLARLLPAHETRTEPWTISDAAFEAAIQRYLGRRSRRRRAIGALSIFVLLLVTVLPGAAQPVYSIPLERSIAAKVSGDWILDRGWCDKERKHYKCVALGPGGSGMHSYDVALKRNGCWRSRDTGEVVHSSAAMHFSRQVDGCIRPWHFLPWP